MQPHVSLETVQAKNEAQPDQDVNYLNKKLKQYAFRNPPQHAMTDSKGPL